MKNGVFPDQVIDIIANKRRILVVDGSRVVRTTLTKRLEDSFCVVEEDNGESAWQRLMLDNNIIAVVSSLAPPRLKAHDLLERMRTSALRRLHETPMVLLVSDDIPDAETEEWQRQGIAGFMTKSMSKDMMAECLENVLAARSETSLPEMTIQPQDALDEGDGEYEIPDIPQKEIREEALKEKDDADGADGAHEKSRSDRSSSYAPLLGVDDFLAAVASLPHEMSSDESLCILVFGIDSLDELIGRFGADVPDLLNGRIAKLLAAKLNLRDVLGLCGENHVAIVSHGADLPSGVRFGKRVCKSMAMGQIAVYGRKIRLTTSVGVAATSDDRMTSPTELLTLAHERMKQATMCGGNTVCVELRPDCMLSRLGKPLMELFGLLGKAMETEQKEALNTAARPLLRKVDTKFANEVRLALGLPMDKADEADEAGAGGE